MSDPITPPLEEKPLPIEVAIDLALELRDFNAARARWLALVQQAREAVGVPAEARLATDAQGRPVAFQWPKPAEKVVPAETVTSRADDGIAPPEAAK